MTAVDPGCGESTEGSASSRATRTQRRSCPSRNKHTSAPKARISRTGRHWAPGCSLLSGAGQTSARVPRGEARAQGAWARQNADQNRSRRRRAPPARNFSSSASSAAGDPACGTCQFDLAPLLAFRPRVLRDTQAYDPISHGSCCRAYCSSQIPVFPIAPVGKARDPCEIAGQVEFLVSRANNEYPLLAQGSYKDAELEYDVISRRRVS